MAIIRPFNALRPDSANAYNVASPPYDVVSTEEAKEIVKDNPLSFLRVTRAEVELPDDINPYSDEVYQKAKLNLEKIKKEAPLILEDNPSFYLYRLIMDGRSQIGIAATFSIDDYDNDVIKKHEKTRKEKEDDRTKHIITTGAQTGPVFLTYKGIDEINKIILGIINYIQPIYDFKADDEIQHTIWIIPDEFNLKIIEEISKVRNLYIADGHHRAASASRARKVKMQMNPNHSGNEEYNYFIAVLFPKEQLQILPYNRVVKDLNGLSKEEFLNVIGEKFVVENTDTKQPTENKTFCMYLDGEWFSLKIRDSISASLSLAKSEAEKLDVSILQNFLLHPILGIIDPRTDKRIDFVGGIRGTSELEKLVDTEKYKVAFSLFPVSVDDLIRISDAGEIMPPKSTWFEPKLRDGLLVHLI